jgi:hypothetical protein
MTKKQPLLSQFLGDSILVFLSEFDQDIQTEDGGVATVPMVLQGVLVDIDDNFILLGDETNGGFSLVAISHIGKIDTINEATKDIIGKIDKGSMN